MVTVLLVAALLNLSWERVHIVLYRNYERMKGRMPVFVFATLGDVLYTFFALALIALFKRDAVWFLNPTILDYAGLAILGFCIAIFVEYKAMALKRWEYTENMPCVFGIGLSPLVQMTVLLPLSVFINVYIHSYV